MPGVSTSSGVIGGVDLDRQTTDPEFALGTTLIGDDGFPYVYVQASGSIAGAQTDIAVDAAYQASDGLGAYINGADAWADNAYGWVKDATRVAT